MNAAVHLPDPLAAEGNPDLPRDPFQTRYDDAFYFDEAVRAKRLNLLFHLVPYSDVLLVTGEQGSGKSSLLHRLLAGANDSWRICRFQATAEIDAARLLEILHTEFSLRPDGQGDDDQRLRLLRESLYALRHSALIPVLIIDDAHLLTYTAFGMLAALTEPWQAKDKLLSVVLFGEPEINKKLIAPGLEALRARVSHTFDIPPLSEEETGKYIRHRLSVADIKEAGPFTDSVLKFIHVASRGYPGRINEFARVVLQNSEQKDARIDLPASIGSRGRVYLKYGIAALLVSLAVVGLLYQDRLLDLMASPKKGETASLSGEPSPSLAESEVQDATVSPPAGTAPAIKPDNAESIADESAATDAAAQPEAILPLPNPNTDTAPALPSVDASQAVASDQTEAMSTSSSPSAAGPVSTAASDVPVSDDDKAIAAGQTAVSAGEAPTVSETETPHDGEWLLAQDPAYYTLQLLVANRSQCLAYIKRYALGDAAAIFQTRTAGQTYFSLVYGIYTTELDAVDAGKALSEQDVKISPWVRKVAAIQARIREFDTATEAPPSLPVNTINNNKGVTAQGELRREPWLLEQSSDAYTLQLFAGKEANVLAYLKRHSLLDDVALFHPADAADRLTVTFGVYPSRAEALQAGKELAAQLPDIKPWARPLREIQAVISPPPAANPPSP